MSDCLLVELLQKIVHIQPNWVQVQDPKKPRKCRYTDSIPSNLFYTLLFKYLSLDIFSVCLFLKEVYYALMPY